MTTKFLIVTCDTALPLQLILRPRKITNPRKLGIRNHERKNKPALKYGISEEIQHLLVVDQWYKAIIKDTE